jgi:probable rRNA maturation factor
VLEVELHGARRLPSGPAEDEIEALCRSAARAGGVFDGHLAIELVDAGRIAELNATHRGRLGPTDVLSFPIDGAEPLPAGAPRELGDVVICPEYAAEIREAIVHGVLHLLGMDHERDDGEMLELQAEILRVHRMQAGA